MEEIEKKKVYIYQCKLSKRVFAFLADLFLTLILAVLFFEGVTVQVAKPISNYSDKVMKIESYSNSRIDIFYDREILYFKSEETKYDFDNSVEHTEETYIENLVKKTSSKYDVFANYFVTYRKFSVDDFNNKVIEFNDVFFEVNNGKLCLKSKYIDEFLPNYTEGDEMSEAAATDFKNFSKSFFLPFYNEMMKEIKNNDLISTQGVYYSKLTEVIDELTNELNNMYVFSSIFAYLFSVVVLYFMIPFIDKKGRTISQMILKIERVDVKSITYLKKPFIGTVFLLNLFGFLPILMFIPLMSINFASLFSIPYLWIISTIGLGYDLINFTIMVFNQLNRSVGEFLTNSIVVETAVIDEYYKEMEYGRKN